jgi:hypothetical protein
MTKLLNLFKDVFIGITEGIQAFKAHKRGTK